MTDTKQPFWTATISFMALVPGRLHHRRRGLSQAGEVSWAELQMELSSWMGLGLVSSANFSCCHGWIVYILHFKYATTSNAVSIFRSRSLHNLCHHTRISANRCGFILFAANMGSLGTMVVAQWSSKSVNRRSILDSCAFKLVLM